MECCKINGRKICVGKEREKKPVGTIGPAKGCFEKWRAGGRNVGKRTYMALHARRHFPTCIHIHVCTLENTSRNSFCML
jgi:hypothetical protein